ncbi:TPA: HD domain-containing protein [Vibrio cholerae]|uniref:HD domain-containing protein n=2 Tax=Vibrio TaxID=662 RepID=A0A5B1C4Y4_VIBCL|nr:HD domain-containing protein [Vibrio cholerae]AKO77384.1 hypothetical protein EN12_19620 [Vibrio cholerae]KAA1255115.1 HD domain-containing protein [Vibrio cholerae]HDV5624245.1 HD domain-containing protein [Vibrio cholerae]
MSKTNRAKFVMCPVHGAIEISSCESAAIDHYLIQKNRHILQNDVLQYVFPGATHNRFSHSIGAMHIAGRVISKIISVKTSEYLKERFADNISSVSEKHQLASDYLINVIRLAALFHDTGHAAFSHQIEKTNCLHYIFENESTFLKLWEGIDFEQFYEEVPATIEHEHYSVRAAYEIMTDIDAERLGIRIKDVLSVLETTKNEPSETLISHSDALWEIFSAKSFNPGKSSELSSKEKATKILSLLQTILSSELDIDKMDYLNRDSFYCGVAHGTVDLGIIIQNISAHYDEESGWFGMTVNSKALGILQNFVYSRYSMFEHVYNHKTSNGFELLLNLAIEEVMSDEETRKEIEGCFTCIESFADLTDDYLWQKIKTHSKKFVGSYCRKLIRRQRLKYLGHFDYKDSFDIKAKISELESKTGSCVNYRIISTKFSSIDKEYDQIKVSSKCPIDNSVSLVNIGEASSFFGKHTNKKEIFFHET